MHQGLEISCFFCETAYRKRALFIIYLKKWLYSPNLELLQVNMSFMKISCAFFKHSDIFMAHKPVFDWLEMLQNYRIEYLRVFLLDIYEMM